MTVTISRIYNNYPDAQAAIKRLEAAGAKHGDISVLASNADGWYKDGQPAKRLDVLASDGSGSTIVAWPAGAPGRVMVLLAADLGDAKVLDALKAIAGG